jgi:4'-phosphopantetheinyl transferase EntD
VSVDPQLARDLASLAGPDLRIGHRVIQPGDEDALLFEEAVSMVGRTVEARRASGAARLVARELMAGLGVKPAPIRRTPAGAPDWPARLTGSLAHDDTVAVAAVAPRRKVARLGIDVEPAIPLPVDMHALVLTPQEQQRLGVNSLEARLHFAAKEAVYKAFYPATGRFLEFQDIEVDVPAGVATVRGGGTLALRFVVSSRLVALALAT